MWTAQSSVSSSELQLLLNTRSTYDGSYAQSQCPDVTPVDALDWQQEGTTDYDDDIDVDLSWLESYSETAVCSETVVTIKPYFDDEDTSVHEQCESPVDSIPATAWPQQQMSGSCSYNIPQTLSSEHHLHQQQEQHLPHQQVGRLAEWRSAERIIQMTSQFGNQLQSAAATPTCSRETMMTTEEKQHPAGSCKPCSLTYRGRRLRQIAPKPTPVTVTYTHNVVQPCVMQPCQTIPAPKTTLRLVLFRSAASTTTPSNSNTEVK